MARPIDLSLSAPVVDAAPGGEAEIAVVVHNRSGVVKQVELLLEGAAAPWGRLARGNVTVEPGEDTRVRMKVRPPDRPDVQAGPVGYTIIAITEGQERDGPAEISGAVDVGIHQDWDVSLDPAELASGGHARTRLRVLNRGNVLLFATALSQDPSEEVHFRLGDTSVTVQPGSEVVVPVKVWPIQRSWSRPCAPQGFDIVLEAAGGVRRSAHGTFRKKPAAFTIGLRAIVVAVAVLVVGVVAVRFVQKVVAERAATTVSTDWKGLPVLKGPTLPSSVAQASGQDGPGASGPAAPVGDPGLPLLLRRYYQPLNGDFVYTTDANQGAKLISEGFQAQGDAGNVLTQPAAGTVPLYRLRRPDNGHIFTMDQGERQGLLGKAGYQDEGIAAHLYPSPAPGTIPLYVMKKGETYLLTRDEDEVRQRAPGGWVSLGVRGYVLR